MTELYWDPLQWPENIWLGTSVENQEMANKRLPILAQIPAKIRFLSVEPLIGPVTLGLVGQLRNLGAMATAR